MSALIEADLTWTGERFERGVRVAVSDEGRIERVGKNAGTPTKRLAGRALLPGMVDAHSHAFQRGLRGRGERFTEGAGDFWSWREEMYGLVHEMDAERLHALSSQAFREMLAAGITTVGEFHYLHHDDSGRAWALDEAVLAAAREVGIRLVLLQVYYRTGGIGVPLSDAQRRFDARSPAEYWEQMDRLGSLLDPATQSLGSVVHSIRAASLEDLRGIHAESRRRKLVFHMHVEEQRKEIEECRASHGATPMALINEHLEVDPAFTAVHCTHTAPDDLAQFVAAGGNVCICPLTEANLGDGIADVSGIVRRGGSLSLGTDSNARVSMIEEMRWLEYAQRLTHERRGILRDGSGKVARSAFGAATRGGARALGVHVGSIEPGAWADFCTLDLGAPALAGWTPYTLLEALVFGAGDGAIAEVCVGGRWCNAST